AARLCAAAAKLAENIADIDCAHLCTRHARYLEHRHATTAGLHFNLYLFVVPLACSQFLSETLPRGRASARADQCVEDALFCRLLGTRLNVLPFTPEPQLDPDLNQIAHDLFNVATDISDFGEFCCLDFQKRRAGKPRESAGDLSLAGASRADHQDVLRQHFLAQPFVELKPSPPVAQSDSNGALCVALADNKAVEFGNDFARRKIRHDPICALLSVAGLPFADRINRVNQHQDVQGEIVANPVTNRYFHYDRKANHY